jgi:predicted kinase
VKKHGTDWKRFNRDDLRAMVDVSVWSPENEKFIISLRNAMLETALRRGYNVILDDTNFKHDNWTDVCNICERANIDVMVMEKVFPVDIDTAVERDKARPGTASVGEAVITNMWKKYVKGKPDAMKPRVQHFYRRDFNATYQDPKKPKAIIVDLDGTLAIMGDRSPFDASKCDLVDKPNTPVVELVKNFHAAGYTILFVSGRENKDRDPTMRFISKYVPEVCCEYFHDKLREMVAHYKTLPPGSVERQVLESEAKDVGDKLVKIDINDPGSKLWMRATADNRKDTIVKKEIYEREIAGKYNVVGVVDDRPSVCRMWRYDIGLLVFQVHDREF